MKIKLANVQYDSKKEPKIVMVERKSHILRHSTERRLKRSFRIRQFEKENWKLKRGPVTTPRNEKFLGRYLSKTKSHHQARKIKSVPLQLFN